jgi:tRNA pseudouridine55 synthase
LDGVIVIDKPEGWTSHDVVGKMRRIAQTKRIGHLGTLDPFATGVLPLVVGRATRLARFYTRSDKIYEGAIRFGRATNTYDRTGEPLGEACDVHIEAAGLQPLLDRFRGEFLQMPPPVSAKKIAGRRAYELARKDIAVELPPSPVNVYELIVLSIEDNLVKLRVHCSGGTYLRSIAHDLGAAMGCGAHLAELRRMASGEFEIANARTIAQLEALAAGGGLSEAIVPMAQMMPAFPSVFVDEIAAAQVRHGRNFNASPFRAQADAKFVKAVTGRGELVAIGEAVLPNVYHPAVVL